LYWWRNWIATIGKKEVHLPVCSGTLERGAGKSYDQLKHIGEIPSIVPKVFLQELVICKLIPSGRFGE
jgi:hypothetical protein